jgi:UDP-N-acetylmuramoyl-tripeptide--D-alanyl-D-alanine ligase
MHFDEQFVRGALADVEIQGVFPSQVHFSVDSRTLNKGDIFIALPGAHHQGHDFLADAIARNAAGFMLACAHKDALRALDHASLQKLVIIVVPCPLQALVRLAAAWRAQFTYPVVAITGSVGKTSTKELLARILDLNGTVYVASQGNQNTRIGISLNILRMRAEHHVAIFEVGINKRGEMAELAGLLRPTTGIITSVGHCHMEGLGSLADIALEKRDLFKYFTEDSIGIINGDQPLLAAVGYTHPVIKFGSKTINQIQARKIQIGSKQMSFVLKIYKEKYHITVKQVHHAVIFNSLAAAAAAYLLKVPLSIVVRAIADPVLVAGRFERRLLKNNKGALINDCYNANPESMKAALLAFQKIETSAHKIAVLGDMLELGLNSPFWHRQLGRFLRKVPSLKHVVLVGQMVTWTKKTVPVGITVDIVPTWVEAVEQLNNLLGAQSLVLIKGSRGVGLTNVVNALSISSESSETV